jgi:ABC-type sugar transport system substrate-binding protein
MENNLMRKFIVMTVMLLLTVALAQATLLHTTAQSQLGGVDDLKVSDSEIAAAQQALGDSVVGVLACTIKTEYHKTVASAAIEQLTTYGLNAELFDSQTDATRQIAAIQSYADRGVKVLIICILDPKAEQQALADAAQSGVQFIQFAGREASAFGGVTISVQDTDLGSTNGQFAGQLIAKELNGKANVAILDYPSVPNVIARADSIEKALKKEAPDAVIVGRFLGGTLDNGYKSIKDALVKFPDINVIVSINDAGGLGALKALQDAGKKPGDVIIVGIDGDPAAKAAILNDLFFRGTVDTSAQLTGSLTAQAAVKLLAGSKFTKDSAVPATLLDKAALQALAAPATPAATEQPTTMAATP